MNRCSAFQTLVTGACLILAAAGCGPEKVDYAEKLDHTIVSDWKKNWLWVDAARFFQTGGLFIDSGEPGDPILDRPHIAPFLKLLHDKHGLNWQAVVHKKKTKFAVALVAQLPSSGDTDAIKATIDEEQKRFPGEILWQFGHQYMSVDFLTNADLEWERQAELKTGE